MALEFFFEVADSCNCNKCKVDKCLNCVLKISLTPNWNKVFVNLRGVKIRSKSFFVPTKDFSCLKMLDLEIDEFCLPR